MTGLLLPPVSIARWRSQPDYVLPKIGLAYLEVFRNGNPAAGRKILQNIPADCDSDRDVALARWDLAMLERDYATAEKVLTDSQLEDFAHAGDASKTFYQGRIALARGDTESAQRYFAAAAPDFRKAGARRSRRCRASCRDSDYSTPTCRGRRMPFEKVVEPSNSSQKTKTHFMAPSARPIWRWSMRSLASRTRRSR